MLDYNIEEKKERKCLIGNSKQPSWPALECEFHLCILSQKESGILIWTCKIKIKCTKFDWTNENWKILGWAHVMLSYLWSRIIRDIMSNFRVVSWANVSSQWYIIYRLHERFFPLFTRNYEYLLYTTTYNMQGIVKILNPCIAFMYIVFHSVGSFCISLLNLVYKFIL